VWSPDGSRLVFASTQRGAADVFVKRAGGAAKETLLLETDGSTPTMAWSPDGKYIAVLLPGLGFATFDAAAPDTLTRFEEGESDDSYYEPQFAPNGRFVSYGSIESGRAEVFVQPWPPSGEKVQVSVGGGTDARWNPMGSEFFYLSPDRKLMSVSLKSSGNRLEAGTPVPLFQTRIAGPLGTGHRFPYAVSRDGQRFLMYAEEAGSTAAITVILNWPSLLPD
jgi:eukaryotic-like serine/threonine-protein kinase